MNTQEKFAAKSKRSTRKSNRVHKTGAFLRLAKKAKPPNTRYIYQMIEQRKIIQYTADSRITYGIAVIEVIGKTERTIMFVSDVSDDADLVKHLTSLCNEHRLFPIHLCDVIEDTLAVQT